MLYTLIFTFALGSPYGTSNIIPEFKSVENCVAAANVLTKKYTELLVKKGWGKDVVMSKIAWECVPYKK